MPTLDTTIFLLQHYGYVLLFLIAVIEGPIISVIASFLVLQGFFNIYLVLAVVVVADLVGDVLHYAPGRWWGEKIFQKYFKSQEKHMKQLEKRFQTKGGRTLLFGKLTHASGFVILIAAGVAKMPLSKFLWYNLLGTIPKSLFFIVIGYYLGYAYNKINKDIETATLIIGLITIAAVIIFFLRKKVKEKEL
ncbi:MAG TPA: VTT domain-containing protein [Candidatus Paceibacterota bacterium]|nr:VTT domain-containing protein [Candidatus Paceibacterota bacterium]